MFKHAWYTCDQGMGIECDKCGASANLLWTPNFHEVEQREDCPISDEEELFFVSQ